MEQDALKDYSHAENYERLATAFCNRGNVYADKGEYDRAIQKYNQSIGLNPSDGATFYIRGNAYASKGDYKRAIQDLNEAVRLQPEYMAFISRGAVRFEQADFAASVLDFTMSSQLAPTDIYNLMWLYLARARAGLNPEGALSSAQKLDLTSWPGPLIALYRGESFPNAVMVAAANPDPKKERSQMCDAHFYIAEYGLLRGLRDETTRVSTQNPVNGDPAPKFEVVDAPPPSPCHGFKWGEPDIAAIALRLVAATALSRAAFLLTGKWKGTP